MNRTFDFYEYAGLIIPGAGLTHIRVLIKQADPKVVEEWSIPNHATRTEMKTHFNGLRPGWVRFAPEPFDEQVEA